MSVSSAPRPVPVPLTESIQALLLRELESVRLEIDAYHDERSIWAMPPGMPNSGGTLALHLAGNLRHYIGAVLGGSEYVRDREWEFAARDLPRHDLREAIDEAEAAIRATLPRLTDEDLAGTYPESIRGYRVGTRDMLLHLAVHLAYHLGQLSYHRRTVTRDPQGVGALPSSALPSARAESDPPRGSGMR